MAAAPSKATSLKNLRSSLRSRPHFVSVFAWIGNVGALATSKFRPRRFAALRSCGSKLRVRNTASFAVYLFSEDVKQKLVHRSDFNYILTCPHSFPFENAIFLHTCPVYNATIKYGNLSVTAAIS